ncbi:MAG: phosphoribosyl-ATP diphosphatase [Rhodospirillaceae bacterium]|nr:phosphoribosyl-ATP diphosphatase [Rhodospirillaceae bacterium]MBL6930397.1 phosphoribosyl-ATP diphosphatase [Rhodospirillales bacterium]
MNEQTIDSQVLERLFQTIRGRHGESPETSYTAKLFAGGRGEIARKVGEEATETIVASLDESEEKVVMESADLLYHLLVLWADVGIDPSHVWAELARREGTSGIDEKSARGK